jgi:protein-disulfide isomerase
MWHDSSDMTIRREYIDNGKVRLAFVNFPINSHQNAIPAAEYAMCAAAQDKFWQAHDSLFAHQETWAPVPDPGPALERITTSAGVEVNALSLSALETQDASAIEADREKARAQECDAVVLRWSQMLEGVQPVENPPGAQRSSRAPALVK